MALRTYHHHHPFISSINFTKSPSRNFDFSVRSCMPDSIQSRKLVLEVKEKLLKDHKTLPVGKCGRDDDEMILWFLKVSRFSVEETVGKLTKAIVSSCLLTSKLCLPLQILKPDFNFPYKTDFCDVNDRPVLLVVASNHFPDVHDPVDDQKLCAFLIEKALRKLPPGKDDILGIIDLRNFSTSNADLKFLTFVFDVFYYYYPKRLGQVLFVEAPFVFKPIWQLAKPLLKSHTSLVRFCSVQTVRKEYFTEETVPTIFSE
ncbi:CRAL-TRIO domain-containing protein C365.01 [Linum perenne]